LAIELALKAPFLLKLDIQGAEIVALSGASEVLSKTNVVICEADMTDFFGINSIMERSGFALYDLTALSRLEDGTLGWFYPVYVSTKLQHCLPKAFWSESQNSVVIQAQSERRASILKWNSAMLQEIKMRGLKKTGRNDPCPCGSGRKFKHCHGTIMKPTA